MNRTIVNWVCRVLEHVEDAATRARIRIRAWQLGHTWQLGRAARCAGFAHDGGARRAAPVVTGVDPGVPGEDRTVTFTADPTTAREALSPSGGAAFERRRADAAQEFAAWGNTGQAAPRRGRQ